MNVEGLALELARNSVLDSVSAKKIVLELDENYQGLCTDKARASLSKVLNEKMGLTAGAKLEIRTTKDKLETVAHKAMTAQQKLLDKARESIKNDPHVQKLIETFGARVDEDSIKYNQ